MKHDPYSLSDWLGYLSHKEIDFLQSLTQDLRKNPLVVNIGAGGGTSALTILKSRPDISVITIDIQRAASPLGSLEGEETVLRDAGMLDPNRYYNIQGDSKQIGKTHTVSSRGIDMVFIDGDHSYEGASGDILAWLPHIIEGGVIALHDYDKIDAYERNNPDHGMTREQLASIVKPYDGVDQAVHEHLLVKYPMIGHIDSLVAFLVTWQATPESQPST